MQAGVLDVMELFTVTGFYKSRPNSFVFLLVLKQTTNDDIEYSGSVS